MPQQTLDRSTKILLLSAALLITLSLTQFCRAQDSAANAAVTVKADKKIGVINPNIYGHFAEHLGTCIYEGIWVGPDSTIKNVRGIRTDVVEALKKIKPPVIRWPGGCFADGYHWKDGIGPRDKRPKTVNIHWGRVIENNAFGTDEFIDFCRQVGAEPLIGANVGSGTPEEMRDWLEYVNFAGDSTFAKLRAQNGRPEPFNVKYICIGNENWGCGGGMSPVFYADLYRQFSTFCYFPPQNGKLYLIACGPNGANYDWTEGFFKVLVGLEGKGPSKIGSAQAFDMHYYTNSKGRGTATEYNVDQWYSLIAKALRLEPVALKHWEIMGQYDKNHRVKLAVCEWGTWHQVMPGTNQKFLRQQNTVRDALIAALSLNIFNNHCDKIDMTNIAQTINVLQSMILTDGPKMILTPTFHVFEMYVPHQGADGLECDVTAPKIDFNDIDDKQASVPRLTASCSRKADTLTLSLVNTHASKDVTVTIDFEGLDNPQLKSWRTLASSDIHAHNTFEKSDNVVIHDMSNLGSLMRTVVLPPASVNVLTYSAK